MIKINDNAKPLIKKHLSHLYKRCLAEITTLDKSGMNTYQKKYFKIIESNLEEILIGDKLVLDLIKFELENYINFGNKINNIIFRKHTGGGSYKKNISTLKNEISQVLPDIQIPFSCNSSPKIKKEAISHIDELLNIEMLIDKTNQIFNYSFLNSDTEWNRHRIISEMNICVCPYCDRQYITNYHEDNQKKTTADLDHYYPQSKYPYFALSLYNFIPSCQICNSRMKGSKEGHLYPYKDEFGDMVSFTSNKTTVLALINSNKDNIEITIDINDSLINDDDYKQRLKNSIEIFKLNKVYKTSHNQYLYDMLKYIERTPKVYIKSIEKLLNTNIQQDSLKNEEAVLRTLIKEPFKDRIRRKDTLSKLTSDILKEFGLY